jgi:hypothetical protein
MTQPKSKHRVQREGEREESVRTVIRRRRRPRRTRSAGGAVTVARHVPRPVPAPHREEDEERPARSSPKRRTARHRAEAAPMASSRNLSTYNLSLKEQQYLARRGYESIATRDWGPPGLRAGAGRGSISMQPRAEKARREPCGRGECARHDEDETRQHASLEVKLKRAPLQVQSWAGVLGWA